MTPDAIEKILVPVDFSEGGQPALTFATMMARTFRASIDLLHIWQPPPLIPFPVVVVPSSGESTPMHLEELARTNAGAQMKALVERLRDQGVAEVHSRVASAAQRMRSSRSPSLGTSISSSWEPTAAPVSRTPCSGALPRRSCGARSVRF